MRIRGRRRTGPVATYAAVLDGVHLWLDVDGPVTLRETGGRDEVDLGEHPYDLGGLVGSAYHVLAAGKPVVMRDRSDSDLSRTPLAPDGVTRWELDLDEDGHVRLRRSTVPATAELDAVGVRGDRVHLRVRPRGPVQPGSHLLLLDQDDAVLETLPMTAHDGLLEALIGVDDLPAGWFGMLRLAVGTDQTHVRIRRRADDLADPHRAVLLPELYDDARDRPTERPRARLRWNADGLLALRSIGPDEAL